MRSDLGERWRRARRAALRPLVVAAEGHDVATDDDDALEARALAHDRDRALRAVFDVSLRLGDSFRRYFRVDLPMSELGALLPQLGEPCAERAWQPLPGEAACRSERAPCSLADAGRCALRREALEGLVLGLSSAVRFGRHASAGAGDPTCVDVLYVHPASPVRFGPIPPETRAILDSIARTARALDPSLDLELLGISENVLYYRASSAGDGERERGHSSIEPAIRRRLPALGLREVSARPVLAP